LRNYKLSTTSRNVYAGRHVALLRPFNLIRRDAIISFVDTSYLVLSRVCRFPNRLFLFALLPGVCKRVFSAACVCTRARTHTTDVAYTQCVALCSHTLATSVYSVHIHVFFVSHRVSSCHVVFVEGADLVDLPTLRLRHKSIYIPMRYINIYRVLRVILYRKVCAWPPITTDEDKL